MILTQFSPPDKLITFSLGRGEIFSDDYSPGRTLKERDPYLLPFSTRNQNSIPHIFKNILIMQRAPTCNKPACTRSCEIRKAGPASKNPGRDFWSCPLREHGFTSWADMIQVEQAYAPQLSTMTNSFLQQTMTPVNVVQPPLTETESFTAMNTAMMHMMAQQTNMNQNLAAMFAKYEEFLKSQTPPQP